MCKKPESESESCWNFISKVNNHHTGACYANIWFNLNYDKLVFLFSVVLPSFVCRFRRQWSENYAGNLPYAKNGWITQQSTSLVSNISLRFFFWIIFHSQLFLKKCEVEFHMCFQLNSLKYSSGGIFLWKNFEAEVCWIMWFMSPILHGAALKSLFRIGLKGRPASFFFLLLWDGTCANFFSSSVGLNLF